MQSLNLCLPPAFLFGTLNWDKTQMAGSESMKTSTKYTALDVDSKRK